MLFEVEVVALGEGGADGVSSSSCGPVGLFDGSMLEVLEATGRAIEMTNSKMRFCGLGSLSLGARSLTRTVRTRFLPPCAASHSVLQE